MKSKKLKGFTLIELMIVVAIIGILAAIAIPNFLRYQLRAKFGELKENVSSVFKSQEALRQGERKNPDGKAGQYYSLGVLPGGDSGCTPGTTKLPWGAGDLKTAMQVDWIIEGETYGCYYIGTSDFSSGNSGTNLTVQAVSNVDGDSTNACVVLYKPTLSSEGVPTVNPFAADCEVDGVAAPDGTTPPYGQPINVATSGDSVF